MDNIKTGQPGTVIEGTLRPQDLLPRFLDLLEVLHPAAHQQVVMTGCGFPPFPDEARDDEDHPFWSGESVEWVMESVMDALSDCAPEGHYFGAHPGDGADFGFWEIES